MNIGGAKKAGLRTSIRYQGLSEGHAAHDEQLCNYADAAAEDMYEQIVKDLPTMIEVEVNKYLKENPYALEVD